MALEMLTLLHLLFFYNLIIWKSCVSIYTSETNLRMKDKLQWLCRELVTDAISKVQSIQHYKDDLSKSVHYQYGNIMYEMTYRQKLMFKLYTQVLEDMESPVVEDKLPPGEMNYLAELAEMDSLGHEIMNFATMIQVHHANIHEDKSKPGYDLFFRRLNVAPAWLGLLDSMDNNDHPEPPPENHNLTRTGIRKNGVWHYAVPND